MNKILFSLIMSSSILLSEVVNGIALTVNDTPITMYDIQETMNRNNIHKNKAVSVLIDKILYDQLVKKHHVTADVFDINEYVEKLAANNKMDTYQFKSIVKQKYSDYSIFEREAKNIIIRQKLIKEIIKGQLKVASEEDMKNYYEKNKNIFSTFKTFETFEYTSKNKKDLIALIKNPLKLSKNIKRKPVTFDINEVNSQVQYLLNNTKENSFSPIFIANKFYTTLFINKKEGRAELEYKTVKNRIFAEIMEKREKKYLKDYFEKEKLTADIKIVR